MSTGPAPVPDRERPTPALRMPAEWAPHERTLMCWPARETMWGARFADAKRDHALVAEAIAAFEPVTMVVAPAQEAEARVALPRSVEVVAIPIDDSWVRDSGPIFVVGGGRRAGVSFRFNAWGEKFVPYADDDALARRLLEHLGVEALEADFVLEGGSIAVDGEGTLVTTEQCLLNPNRNPGLSRAEIEAGLSATLGVERVVWLGRGLVEDADTDGHVDNICAFLEPGRVLLQTVADESNPNWPHCADNARRLRAAGLDVVELPQLPYADAETVVPYTNFYVCNGALIVPVLDPAALTGIDREVLAQLESLFRGREAVPVPGETLAHGGGGVHCITQQVPAP